MKTVTQQLLLLTLLVSMLAACGRPAAPPPTAAVSPPTAVPPTTVPESYPVAAAPSPPAPPAAYPAVEVEPGTISGAYPAVGTETAVTAVPVYGYQIIHTYDHDPNSFTQGLIWEGGIFYEGSGLYGQSTLRKVDVTTGEVLTVIELPEQYFGEGITTFGDHLIQLTWKAQTGFVYDKESFELLQEFSYPTQGWGITHDGERLIMSDGTAVLYFWDPDTLLENDRVTVHDENGPVLQLNELEYIEGEVWANIWQTNRIARIDPATGRVIGWIDLTGLLDPADVTQKADVLNGIAYDDATDRLFVTGKLWPKLYEIELVSLE